MTVALNLLAILAALAVWPLVAFAVWKAIGWRERRRWRWMARRYPGPWTSCIPK